MSRTVPSEGARARPWLPWVIAVVLTVALIGVRVTIGFESTDNPALVLLVVPVLIAALLGGLGPGLLATAVAAIGSNIFILAPRPALSLDAGVDSAQWIGLIVVGAGISALGEALRRVQDRARVDRERHAVTLAHLSEGVLVTDGDFRVTYLNEEAERLTGVPAGAARGRAVTDVLRLEGLSAALDASTSGRGDRPVGLGPERLMRPDGDAIPVAGTVSRVRDGGATRPGAVVVVRDRSDAEAAERARTDRALQSRLTRIASGAPWVVGTLRRDPDGRLSVPFAGPGARELLGIDPAELTSDVAPLLARIDPGDRRRAGAGLAAAAEARTPWRAEFRLDHPVHGRRWIGVNAVPDADAAGSLLWHAFVDDVTERRRADEAAVEQARLLDLSSDAVFVRDAVTDRISAWNAGAERVYGIPAARAVGEVSHDLLGTRWTDGGPAVLGTELLEHGHWEGVLHHRAADGRELVVLSRQALQRDAAGTPRVVLEVNTDITERVHARQALQDSEDRFRTLVEAAPDVVLGVGADGRIEFAGPQVARLGYEPEELIGEPVDVLVPERHRDVHGAHRARFAAAPVTRSMGAGRELYARRRDGTEVPVEVSLGPAADGSTTVIVVDVTERRRLEGRLRQAEKLEAVGQLAGGVAHDFNNLLTVIRGYGELLKLQLGDGPGGEDVSEILRAGERAAQLTGQLLAFSRQQVLRPTALDLGEVATEVLPMLRRLIGEDVDLVLLADDDLPAVTADRGQLEQVIVNLAVNARDAMPTGGTLTIEVHERRLDEAAAKQRPGLTAGDHVCLIVSDTGMGIDPEVAAHVFEPFFTTKEPGRGTGLGLATVHGIAIQSGGHVEVYSEVGAGTTFKLYLPAASRGTRARARQGAAASAPVGGTETLLVCEDEAAVRSLLERVLGRLGYAVLATSDPREAIGVATEHADRIDLLLTDVVMPGMSGPDLAERVRGLAGPVPTLYMSGYTADTVRRRGRLPVGSAFVEKPFDADELVGEVRRLLDEAADRRAAEPRRP